MGANIDGPRPLRPDEFRDAMALAEHCFGYESGGLEARMPHCFDESRPDRHVIIKRDDEIVSHVVCVPTELRAGDVCVPCYGIAGVATDPDHRGNGYMTQLLEFCLRRAEEDGVPIVELEGDRVGYGRFGWENAGREYRFRITRRSFDAPEPVVNDGTDLVYPVRPGNADLESIERVHEAERYRITRDQDQYERLLGQRGLETLVYDGDRPAYLCHRGAEPTSVLEFGGSERGVATLLDRVLQDDEIMLYTHPHHPLVSLFVEVSTDWTLLSHRKLNVLDLPTVLEAYEPLLEDRWTTAVDGIGTSTTGGSVTLAIAADDRNPSSRETPVTIRFEDAGVHVERTDRKPDLVLDRRTMTHFLFGSPDACYEVKQTHPFLGTVLPLEYYFWQTETI
ncbi:GNAT family N-acetyltransferase [Natronoglomus mannanivorans]|uniref:GNAT family N-acetyltransferase n=1 Tax=Natronoglomus mannanivorans TaxID=2979990 RepID=A0AAP2Z1R9_9EURY|nr:GNAT family N-acetyltransferase [Halobacteria archaeon AArc-xg1-1]